MTDNGLASRFASGGERELEEAMELYGGKLLRYATAILCDVHEAENVIQDVFIQAYQKRNSFDGASLSTWLYKMAYNMSLNQLKKRKPLLFERVEQPALESTEGLSDETLGALKRLNAEERAVLFARIIDEESYEELSLRTGRSQASLRKRYESAPPASLPNQLNRPCIACIKNGMSEGSKK
jgi:RNA polymerase sigma-70 factor (ECF subfamily)